jgi:hypothetical protein
LASHGYLAYAVIYVLDLFWNAFSTVAPTQHIFALAALSKHPFAYHGRQVYYQESPLYFLIAHVLGATTPRRYLLLCIVAAGVVPILFLRLSVKAFGKEKGLVAGLLFLAHPIRYVLNTWLGMVDPLTVACTTVFLFTSRELPAGIAMACSTFNHPGSLFILPSLFSLDLVSGMTRAKLWKYAAGFLGVLFGMGLCRWIQTLYAFTVYTRWDYFQEIPPRHWLIINFSYLPQAIYSFAFALWVPLVVGLLWNFRGAARVWMVYGIVMFGLYGVTFFTVDTTRVFAILSWAPTFWMLLRWYEAPSSKECVTGDYGALLRWFALLGWLAPHLYLWDGVVYSPGVPDILRVIRAIPRT